MAAGSRDQDARPAIVLGVIAVAVGIVWLTVLSTNHAECSSVLVATSNVSACRAVSLRWYLALALIGFGAILGVYAAVRLATKPESVAVRFCAGCGESMEVTSRFCAKCGQSRDTQ